MKINEHLKKRALIFALGSIVLTSPLYGQQKGRVKGTVVSQTGSLLSGVTVTVTDSLNKVITNTATDAKGLFLFESLEAGKSYNIRFSIVGYGNKEENNFIVKPADNNSILIRMEEGSSQLDEVVVVGYGTQKKANLTGAVDMVGKEVFEGRMAANATQMLQGAVPNLNINLADGKPSRSASFNIRGTTSIGQGGAALVLIDGVEGDPANLNPDDIESVSVLKDASSAAIYGSRGTFGVVLISTKKAKQGRTSINYSGSLASQKPTATPQFVTDGYTYASHFSEAYNSWNNYSSIPSKMNKTQPFSLAWLEEFKRRNDAGIQEQVTVDGNGNYVYYGNEDYYKALIKDNTMAQNHNIAINGSSGKTDFYLSGRYYGYDGLYRYNTDKFRSLNLRAKGGIQVTNWLRIANNLDYSAKKYHIPMTVGEGGNILRNIADEGHPTSPIFNPDGTLSYSAAYSVGDFIMSKNGKDTDDGLLRNTTSFETKFFNNTFRVKGDFTFMNKDDVATRIRIPIPYSIKEGEILQLATQYNDISKYVLQERNLFTNIYAEYENTFKQNHYFKGLIGYNYEQKVRESVDVSKNGLLTNDVSNINLALGDAITASGNYEKYRIAGLFFRANYAYKDRYLFEVNGRYDGSSKFPIGSQWAFFPSASLGWRASQEDFWSVNPEIISDLKFRGSYGSLGNGNIKSYSFLQIYNISTSDRIINGERPRYTQQPVVLPDQLTWETATTANFGMDMSFLNGKLQLVADMYTRKTTDMFTVGMTLPDIFGATSPKGNYADMTTNGYELTLSYNNRFDVAGKSLRYSIRGTLADYKSKIDKYNNLTGTLGDYYAGQTVGEIWGYETQGLFQSQAEIDNAAKQILIKSSSAGIVYPGDVRFADLNGDGKIDYGTNTLDNHGDKKIIGNKDPRYIYGFNFNADWNGISLSTFFQGVGRQNWYPSNESIFWGQYNRPYNNLPEWHLNNYWTEDNKGAYLPRYAGYNQSIKETPQTRYLQNVGYIRLKNIQVGYSLPKSIVSRWGFQDIKASLSGENLWSWSPFYKHTRDLDVSNIGSSDPDISDSNAGDGFNYPTMKSISLGISVTF
ncbi:SusC/RagA family TonB-linked outer membrane protein [Sphingobacterium anhuiense]|uniref:SusC/RagA family TonB-linked outer membrane protein n=1 Tax=Sphingobacterium anhuiense TaxID=493780 RepID=UPI003C2CDA36